MSDIPADALLNYEPPSPDEVREFRQRHKLTQVELAEIAHVIPRSVQRWEAPKGSITHRYPQAAQWMLVKHWAGDSFLPRKRRKNRS